MLIKLYIFYRFLILNNIWVWNFPNRLFQLLLEFQILLISLKLILLFVILNILHLRLPIIKFIFHLLIGSIGKFSQIRVFLKVFIKIVFKQLYFIFNFCKAISFGLIIIGDDTVTLDRVINLKKLVLVNFFNIFFFVYLRYFREFHRRRML